MQMARSDSKLSNVLLIDDSAVSEEYLARFFNELNPVTINQSSSFRDAVGIISSQPPDLIITEWYLGDITADKLLQALKSHEKLKEIPIIVHTGSRSDDILNQANRLGADAVFYKPFDHQKLLTTLEGMFSGLHSESDELEPTEPVDAKQVQVSSPEPEEAEQSEDSVEISKPVADDEDVQPLDIRSQIKDIDKLAPMPQAFNIVLEVMRDPKSSASDLSEVIKKDQALTAKILKIVNSAYYGFYRKIGNVQHAIVILGFTEIKNISLAACIIQAYDNSDNPFFNLEEFWRHSLGTAYIARSLSTLKPEFNSEDAFAIGLMHDLGKVVLDQHFSEQFRTSIDLANQRSQKLHEVSTEIMNIDHAEVGAIIAENWKLPVSLVKAIQYHHYPSKADEEISDVYMAHLANYFCHRQGIGNSANPVPDEPLTEALTHFGIDPQDLDSVWESLKIDEETLRNLL